MRRLVLVALVAVAACTKPAAPPEAEAPAITDTPAMVATLTGEFSATSTTAMGITGDLRVEENRLAFGKGFMLDTEASSSVDLASPMKQGGDSFAATMTASGATTVTLRRVTNVIQAADARRQPLCGADTPTFVALAYDTPPTVVSMAVFSGPDTPGPAAANSALCGTFRYDK